MIIDEFAFENRENGWIRTPNIERNLENYNSVLSLEREKVTFFGDKPTYRELRFGISKIDTFFKLGLVSFIIDIILGCASYSNLGGFIILLWSNRC